MAEKRKPAGGKVSAHYSVGDLEQRILAALREQGKDLDKVTVDDLGPVDAFHIRGRQATQELADWADIRHGHRVLDVGSGLGGTGRYLAHTRECEVVGLDLTEEYCRVAEALSALVGLSERTSFEQGSALDMPFADDSFDVVWTEHVQMNIADKAPFYGEMQRVLRPDGKLAFHDIFAGNGDELHYPVPWASDASISHLIAVEDVKRLLTDLGFEPVRWEEITDVSADFFRNALERGRTMGRPPLGLHVLMGEDATFKFTNLLDNLDAGRVRVVQALMRST